MLRTAFPRSVGKGSPRHPADPPWTPAGSHNSQIQSKWYPEWGPEVPEVQEKSASRFFLARENSRRLFWNFCGVKTGPATVPSGHQWNVSRAVSVSHPYSGIFLNCFKGPPRGWPIRSRKACLNIADSFFECFFRFHFSHFCPKTLPERASKNHQKS